MRKYLYKQRPIFSLRPAAREIFLLTIEDRDIAASAFPGQFIHVAVEGKMLRRPFSIFSKTGRRLEILFKVKGEGTRILSQKKKGDILDLLGPLGRPFPLEGKRPLFLAGGIGMAPLHFLSRQFAGGVFVYGVRREEEKIDLSSLKKRGFEIHIVSEEKDHKKITDLVVPLLKETDALYAAGPQKMLKKIARIVLSRGRDGYLSWEERMGCGLGLCQTCVVKIGGNYIKVCDEGPVFRISEVDWNGC